MPPRFKRPPPPPADTADRAEDDEDDFFSRNKKGWSGVKTERISSPTQEDSDSSIQEIERASKKRKGEAVKKSDWTKPGAIPSFDRDAGSDQDDVVFTGIKSSSPAKGRKKGKQREAVRARSITPPPVVPKYQMEAALGVVNMALFGTSRAQENPGGVIDIDDYDIADDPETLEILEQARSRARAQSPSHAQVTPYGSLDGQLPPQEEQQDWVKLKVYWQGPPLEGGSSKWTFQFSLDSSFRRLHETIQGKTGLPEDQIILTHNSRRILLGATPRSLKMRKNGSETVDALPTLQWDAMEQESASLSFVSPLSPQIGNLGPAGFFSPEETTNFPTSEEIPSAQDDNGKEVDTAEVLMLLIRSAKYSTPVSITARKTAKVGKVLEHYLKKVGEDPTKFNTTGEKIPNNARVKKLKIGLSFDGEELDINAEIGSADAEDDDVWDAVGL